MKIFSLAAAGLVLAGTAFAQAPQSQTVAPVDDMAWLAGEWVAVVGERTYREAWLAPVDGVMGGVSVTTRPDRAPVVETIKITTEAAGPTFTSIVPGQPPLVMVRVAGTAPGDAVFENTADTYPRRLSLLRCGEDMCAKAEGVRDGEPLTVEWHFKRPR